jgi:hypothetical protein
MANAITKEHALEIAKKLGATVEKTGAHQIAYIYHRGQLVAQFGIRHGSNKSLPHGHVPGDIHLGPNKAKRLAECSISQKQWIEIMIEKGLIAAQPNEGGDV